MVSGRRRQGSRCVRAQHARMLVVCIISAPLAISVQMARQSGMSGSIARHSNRAGSAERIRIGRQAASAGSAHVHSSLQNMSSAIADWNRDHDIAFEHCADYSLTSLASSVTTVDVLPTGIGSSAFTVPITNGDYTRTISASSAGFVRLQ